MGFNAVYRCLMEMFPQVCFAQKTPYLYYFCKEHDCKALDCRAAYKGFVDTTIKGMLSEWRGNNSNLKGK